MKRIILVFLLAIFIGSMVISNSVSLTSAKTNQLIPLGTVSGKVIDVNGDGVKGATVIVDGQNVKAVTASNGSFRLTGVNPGSVFLYVKTPSKAYLDGETLKSITVKPGAGSQALR